MAATEHSATSATIAPQRTLRRWRGLWLKVHLWIGLIAGFFLSLVGLTGAILVFLTPLARLEVGHLFSEAEPSSAPWRPVSAWIAGAKAHYSEIEDVGVIYGPGAGPVHADVPMMMVHVHAPGGGELHGLLHVDPVTAEPLGMAIIEHTYSSLVLYFHSNFLLGTIGQTIVDWSSVVFFISIATGLYLWWPRPGRWKKAFLARRGARGRALMLDLHNVSALWLLVPLVVAVFTGLYMHKPQWIDPAVRQVSEIHDPDFVGLTSSPPGTCESAPTLDEIVALARTGRADQSLQRIWIPEEADKPIYVALSAPERNPRARATEVMVDRNCPKILCARNAETRTAAEVIKAWLLPLHADLGLGVAGQALVLLAGLLLPFLYVTGIILWLRRKA